MLTMKKKENTCNYFYNIQGKSNEYKTYWVITG